MKKIFLWTLCLMILSSANSIVREEDFDFSITILQSGEFEIEIKEKFHHLSAEQVMKKFYLNDNFQKEIDESITYIEKDLSLDGLDLSLPQSHEYEMHTKVTKYNLVATIKNDCSLEVTDNEKIVNNCKMDTENSKLIKFKKIMEFGNTKTSCWNVDEGSHCETIIRGQPLAIRYMLISRTPQRLAISGAAKTIKTFYKGHNLIANNPNSPDLSSLWNDMMGNLDDNDKLNSNLNISF